MRIERRRAWGVRADTSRSPPRPSRGRIRSCAPPRTAPRQSRVRVAPTIAFVRDWDVSEGHEVAEREQALRAEPADRGVVGLHIRHLPAVQVGAQVAEQYDARVRPGAGQELGVQHSGVGNYPVVDVVAAGPPPWNGDVAREVEVQVPVALRAVVAREPVEEVVRRHAGASYGEQDTPSLRHVGSASALALHVRNSTTPFHAKSTASGDSSRSEFGIIPSSSTGRKGEKHALGKASCILRNRLGRRRRAVRGTSVRNGLRPRVRPLERDEGQGAPRGGLSAAYLHYLKTIFIFG